jgi:hypothetical protein
MIARVPKARGRVHPSNVRLIQTWLPLIDVAFHRYVEDADPSAAHGGATAAEAAERMVTVSQPQPTPASHNCPICEFIVLLGNYSPTSIIEAAPPAHLASIAARPMLPRLIRSPNAASSAQPRAPPDLIKSGTPTPAVQGAVPGCISDHIKGHSTWLVPVIAAITRRTISFVAF